MNKRSKRIQEGGKEILNQLSEFEHHMTEAIRILREIEDFTAPRQELRAVWSQLIAYTIPHLEGWIIDPDCSQIGSMNSIAQTIGDLHLEAKVIEADRGKREGAKK